MPILSFEAENLCELLSKTDEIRGLLKDADLWFRGEGSVYEGLLPSAFRQTRAPRNMEQMRHDEWQMSFLFQKLAPAYIPNPPVSADHASWLMLMQHHGLPTRLLDWTDSILAAAYFAVGADSPDKCTDPAVLWVLAPGKLNCYSTYFANVIPGIDHKHVKPLISAAFARPSSKPAGRTNLALAVYPLRSHPRMSAQRSMFTVHKTWDPLEKHGCAKTFLAKVKIPRRHCLAVRHQIEDAGIRWSTLFPDLDHLAKEIRSDRRFARRPVESNTAR